MPDKPALLEMSFVETIAAIEQSADLSKSMKRHWVCSLRQIGNWLDPRVDPGAVDLHPPAGQSVAPRPAERHGKDRRQPQVQRRSGAALVWQGAQRIPARGGAVGRVGGIPRRYR
jgi:hypothetical protein